MQHRAPVRQRLQGLPVRPHACWHAGPMKAAHAVDADVYLSRPGTIQPAIQIEAHSSFFMSGIHGLLN